MRQVLPVTLIGGLVFLSAYLGQRLAGLPPVVLGALMGLVLLSVLLAGRVK